MQPGPGQTTTHVSAPPRLHTFMSAPAAPIPDDAIAAAKKTLMSPKTLRIMVCAADGQFFMSDGIPPSMCDMCEPAYDSLGTEPLLVPDHKKAPPCYCEYIVIREGSPDACRTKPQNAMFRKIHGAFFVLKYVTSKATLNRIQIEVAQYDQAAIIRTLNEKYGA